MDREVNQVLEQSFTVRQLVEELQGMDQDAPVLFACNYGDLSRTQQALPIAEVNEYESNLLQESGYSQSGVAFNEGDDEPLVSTDEDEDETETVVILTG